MITGKISAPLAHSMDQSGVNAAAETSIQFLRREVSHLYTSALSTPSKLVDAQITNSIVGEGSILKSCSIHHCVLGVRSRVESDVVLQDTLVMGADFFESSDERTLLRERGGIAVGVGQGTTVKEQSWIKTRESVTTSPSSTRIMWRRPIVRIKLHPQRHCCCGEERHHSRRNGDLNDSSTLND